LGRSHQGPIVCWIHSHILSCLLVQSLYAALDADANEIADGMAPQTVPDRPRLGELHGIAGYRKFEDKNPLYIYTHKSIIYIPYIAIIISPLYIYNIYIHHPSFSTVFSLFSIHPSGLLGRPPRPGLFLGAAKVGRLLRCQFLDNSRYGCKGMG
jgi:hypothetical protein